MKSNQLREIIRKLVAEEVQKQLPKLLFEIIGTSSKVVPQQQVTEQQGVRENAVFKPVKKETKQYVKDPVLNKILNETAANPKPIMPYGSSMAELMDGGFDKIGETNEEINNVVAEVVPVNPPPGNANIASIIGNPSKLGAILKKSKEKGAGGGITSTSVLQQW